MVAWVGLVSSGFILIFIPLYLSTIQDITVHKMDVPAIDKAYSIAWRAALLTSAAVLIAMLSAFVIYKEVRAIRKRRLRQLA